MGVGLGVFVGVLDGVGVGLGVEVGVFEGVEVGVLVGVLDGVFVGVLDGVGVGVTVGIKVGVAGPPPGVTVGKFDKSIGVAVGALWAETSWGFEKRFSIIAAPPRTMVSKKAILTAAETLSWILS